MMYSIWDKEKMYYLKEHPSGIGFILPGKLYDRVCYVSGDGNIISASGSYQDDQEPAYILDPNYFEVKKIIT